MVLGYSGGNVSPLPLPFLGYLLPKAYGWNKTVSTFVYTDITPAMWGNLNAQTNIHRSDSHNLRHSWSDFHWPAAGRTKSPRREHRVTPVVQDYREPPAPDQYQLESLRKSMGLDRPLLARITQSASAQAPAQPAPAAPAAPAPTSAPAAMASERVVKEVEGGKRGRSREGGVPGGPGQFRKLTAPAPTRHSAPDYHPRRRYVSRG